MELPQFDKVVSQLQAGTSVPAIVSWFDKEGWLGNMTPSTFTQYLYKFKTERAALIENSRITATESYDKLIGASLPEIDAEQEIDKLILVQKRRVSIDFSTEVSIGKLLESTHKEVKVLGELLAIKMQMNGKTIEQAVRADVGTQLRSLRVNEGEQDRMQDLTDQLFSAIKGSAKNANSPKKKIRLRA